MKVSEIKPNPNNPRIIKDHKFKQLVQSIRDFPEMLKLRPIVIDENNVVLGGNMRLRAIQELGIKEVEVLKASELTENQKQEFIIKDNIPFGEWDWDLLANEFEAEDLSEWGLDLPVEFGIEEEIDNEEMIGTNKDKPFEIVITFTDNRELDKFNKVVKELAKDYDCLVKVIGGEY